MPSPQTKAEIKARIRNRIPECDDTRIDRYFKEAHREIAAALAIDTNRASLALTAGTMNYAIGSGAPWYQIGTGTAQSTADLCRVESVVYRASANATPVPLMVTSVDALNQRDASWRYRASGTPEQFFTEIAPTGEITIGIFPAPSASSSPSTGAGYPRVDVYYHQDQSETLTTVPAAVQDPMVYEWGAWKRYYAEQGNFEQEQYCSQKFDEMLSRLGVQLYGLAKGQRAPIQGPIELEGLKTV